MTVAEAAARLEPWLSGSARSTLVADAARAPTLAAALAAVREDLRAHRWAPFAPAMDRRTRQDGFHALHDWNGVGARVNDDIIPVDVLDYVVARRGGDAPDAPTIAILLDYYFLHILGLLTLRVWDAGAAGANLDRLSTLLQALQGPAGSGHRFAADAETLLLVATSHYEPDEHGYHALLVRARQLPRPNRLRVALTHAASMGGHLRFGIQATYAQDTGLMRADNSADYPWLGFALATLMSEYVETRDAALVEAIANGLSPDPRAFVGAEQATHAAALEDRRLFRELFDAHRADFIDDCGAHWPSPTAYSPLSLFFNFCFNVVKGTVIDALLWGTPRPIALNDLMTAWPPDDPRNRAKVRLAETLMHYARVNPDTIAGRRMPVIVYDPAAGRMAFGGVMRAIKSSGGRS